MCAVHIHTYLHLWYDSTCLPAEMESGILMKNTQVICIEGEEEEEEEAYSKIMIDMVPDIHHTVTPPLGQANELGNVPLQVHVAWSQLSHTLPGRPQGVQR